MSDTTQTHHKTTNLHFDFGTFEGFNFRSQSAIPRHLSAAEVIAWDHDQQGEAEFWPAGDLPTLSLLFQRRSVTADELLHLDRLLVESRGDSAVNYLRLHHAVNTRGIPLHQLTREKLEETALDVFLGSNLTDTRRKAAFDLFPLYFPEESHVWAKSRCTGLRFDPEDFLSSPDFSVEEVTLGEQVAVMVASQ